MIHVSNHFPRKPTDARHRMSTPEILVKSPVRLTAAALKKRQVAPFVRNLVAIRGVSD